VNKNTRKAAQLVAQSLQKKYSKSPRFVNTIQSVEPRHIFTQVAASKGDPELMPD
jgi:hypothetical protein